MDYSSDFLSADRGLADAKASKNIDNKPSFNNSFALCSTNPRAAEEKLDRLFLSDAFARFYCILYRCQTIVG